MKIYLVTIQIDQDKQAYLGTTFDQEQAFEIVRQFLTQNDNFPIENIWVDEFTHERKLTIIEDVEYEIESI